MSEVKKTLIVFPEDPTTGFLENVLKYLFANVPHTVFDLIRIKPSDESHDEALKVVTLPIYRTILFLGHGTSKALFGARNDSYKNDAFIGSKEFAVFKGKELILISCDSSILLKRNKHHGFMNCVGFGDLPTDWNDIRSAREVDAKAYEGFTEASMEIFKQCLVEVVKYSLSDFFNQNLAIREFFDLLALRINKRIIRFCLQNNSLLTALNYSLLRMKHETTYIQFVG